MADRKTDDVSFINGPKLMKAFIRSLPEYLSHSAEGNLHFAILNNCINMKWIMCYLNGLMMNIYGK